MSQVSKQAVEELEKKFRVERELLAGCSVKFGAFERVGARIIPMLRSDPLTKRLIQEWDRLNNDATLLVRAYAEMHAACQQIQNDTNVHPSWRGEVDRILEEVRRGGSCFDLFKELPPCHRVYHKLKSLYVSAIAKTWEITFAPSAWRIIQENGQGELALKTDADPRLLWKQLTIFEECWAIRDDGCCIHWPEAKGEGVEMWMNADSGYRVARRCRLAGDFSFANHYGPDRRTEFFHRERLEQWVDRMFKEIILILQAEIKDTDTVPASPILHPQYFGNQDITPVSSKKMKKTHKRTVFATEDFAVLCPIAEEI